MSTATPMQPGVPAADQEIRIVSHSNLFYWWPVWAVGLLMAILTFVDGTRAAIVPDHTMPFRDATVKVGVDTSSPTTYTGRDVLLIPEKGKLPADNEGKPLPPRLHFSNHSSYGVLWAVVLLLVIVITNVPLRGLWSVVVIVLIVLLSVIFALAGWWDWIMTTIGLLDIRINMGGYLFISIALFALWLITNLFFDRQIYMVFTPGQLKVCLDVGGGETAYDTAGMVIQKQRDDLFRHWVIGLGSGDLIVRTSGANAHEFHLPNVLFVGRKLQMIEQMQRERQVVRGTTGH